MLTLTLTGKPGSLRTDFHYFWGKWVRGFDPAHHCAKCLVGDFERAVSPMWESKQVLAFSCRPGEIFYLCGVAEPYNWSKNFHLPLEIAPGEKALGTLSNGMQISVVGAKAIPFTATSAKELYPRRDYRFLSCRNFQFAAHRFGFVPTSPINPQSISRAIGQSIHRYS